MTEAVQKPMTRRASIHVLDSTLERVSFCVYHAQADRDDGLNPFRESSDRFLAELQAKRGGLEKATGDDLLGFMGRIEEHLATFLLFDHGRWISVFSEYLELGYSRTREHTLAWFAWWMWRGERTRFEEPIVSFEFSDDPGAEFVDLAFISSGKVITALTVGSGVRDAGLEPSALNAGVVADLLGLPAESLKALQLNEPLWTTCLQAAATTRLPLALSTKDVVKDAERLKPEEHVLDV